MAAQYSMPYIVGATLAYGPTRYDAYNGKYHGDQRILNIIDRVDTVHEINFDSLVPDKMPNRVDLHMQDGSIRSAEVMDSQGTPVHPLSTDGVLNKAHALFETIDTSMNLSGIIDIIEQITKCDDVNDLTDLLKIPGFYRKSEYKDDSVASESIV